MALGLALGGCAGTPSGPYQTGTSDAGQSSGPERQALIRVAARQIGTPYRFGGNTRGGFDCSGLVQFAHRQLGIRVPRTSASQWAKARQQRRAHLLPGDLLFFHLGPRSTRHVGIYEGDGLFIHAPSSGKSVRRASLANPFWRQRLIGARSFL